MKQRPVQIGYTPHFEVAQWSPIARVAAIGAGMAALIAAQRMKGLGRPLANFAGISLGLRALLNKDLTQVIGTLLSPTIHLNREIIVHAPSEAIVHFWSRIENYPRFMSFVRKVEMSEQGNLIWEVAGPAGLPVRWESFILSWPPSGTISWQTIPGSPVFNSGHVSVQSLDFSRTKVRVELTYALRGGGLGYAAIRILGLDPRARFKDDLAKMKTLIEEEWKANTSADLSLAG